MLHLSFRNRIAFYYLLSTAVIVLAVFGAIYLVARAGAFSEIDEDLLLEVERHQSDLESLDEKLTRLVPSDEWKEKEHTEIEINPVFVQILDANARFLEKSPNLKANFLKLQSERSRFHDTLIGSIPVRQVQTPLYFKGQKVGYAIIAMSTEAPLSLLENLKEVLFLTFPMVLLILFAMTRFLAGRSIRPALSIIDTASRISGGNINERVTLPRNRDELFVLSETINDLLDRMEGAILREKQFTSDASHELRTPLAVIKGTLEVLVRKPRNTKEYEEKIAYCIQEVDRLSNLVDQLLLLARFESQKSAVNVQEIELDGLILESLRRFSPKIAKYGLTIEFTFDRHFQIVSDAWMVTIIVENLLSNAIKYSRPNGVISISLRENDTSVACSITDDGIGISADDLKRVHEQFYRADAVSHPEIKGTGLGLSLVKRLCDLLYIEFSLESEPEKGTSALLIFTKQTPDAKNSVS